MDTKDKIGFKTQQEVIAQGLNYFTQATLPKADQVSGLDTLQDATEEVVEDESNG